MIKILALFLGSALSDDSQDQNVAQIYNILSLKSGSEKAYMTAALIDNFETEAYLIAQLDQCKEND